MKIAAIGAHPGDVEVSAGALLHKYIEAGHSATAIVLTNGDHGHPSLPPEKYAEQTSAEAHRAAEILQEECFFCNRSSGTLSVTPEAIRDLAALLFRIKPDVVITHARECSHQDHSTCNWLVTKTLQMTPELCDIPVFHWENREDNRGFRTEYFIEVGQADVDAWDRACMSFQFFRDGFYNFNYHNYYRALFSLRGAEARVPFAVAYMRGSSMINGLDLRDSLPGFPLK